MLEERTRACTEMHVRSNAPKSPSENESIGYSLLSLEVMFKKKVVLVILSKFDEVI